LEALPLADIRSKVVWLVNGGPRWHRG
jgi:CII-binding regulator of phage lambda lysogenization HflD